MSHFTVLVIGDNVEEQLAPFHEFECTGIDNQYIQEIDQTEEAREAYNTNTTRRYKHVTPKFPLGKLYDPYLDRFYREPTTEEQKKVGLGSGCGDGISWTSKDWGDGRGYRAKVHFLPEGWEEVEVPTKDVKMFSEYIEGWYGHVPVKFGRKPDLSKKHKYGYTLLDANGEVIKTVDRTNPNSKWDFYQIGRRWNGFFMLKPNHDGTLGTASLICKMDPDYKSPEAGRADQCLKGDIDLEGMRDEAGQKAADRYDLFTSLTAPHPPIVPWDTIRTKHGDGHIDAAREEYHDQPGVKALHANKDAAWFETEEFACSREEYIDKARKTAISTFAVIKDSVWYERGSMGWWGIVTDEKDTNEWQDKFFSLINDLPDNTLLTLVDCHI
jgi:hypothetical protein